MQTHTSAHSHIHTYTHMHTHTCTYTCTLLYCAHLCLFPETCSLQMAPELDEAVVTGSTHLRTRGGQGCKEIAPATRLHKPPALHYSTCGIFRLSSLPRVSGRPCVPTPPHSHSMVHTRTRTYVHTQTRTPTHQVGGDSQGMAVGRKDHRQHCPCSCQGDRCRRDCWAVITKATRAM